MRRYLCGWKYFLGVALVVLCNGNAQAEYEPNDNYSSLVLAFKSTTLSEPICIGAECHEGVSGPAILFSRQLIPNLALGVTGSYLQSLGNTSSVKSGYVSAFAQGIVGLGRSVDIGASLAPLRKTLALCTTSPDSCSTTGENGTDVGAFGKVFLNDKKSVSVTASYNYIDLQTSADQSRYGVSLMTIFAKHHRLDFTVDRVVDTSGKAISGGLLVSYSYLIFR